MAADISAAGMARGLGVRPGQPDVQRHDAGRGREPDERQHEHDAARGGRGVRVPQRVERVAGLPGQHEKSTEDGEETELGQRRVPPAGDRYLGAAPVLDEDEHERGGRDELPAGEERADAARGGHEQHGHDEQRRDRLRDPGARVAGRVDPAGRRGDADRGEEGTGERVDRDGDAGQREQPGDRGGVGLPGHGGDPGDDAGRAGERRAEPGGRHPQARFQHVVRQCPGDRGEHAEHRRGREEGGGNVHRPVNLRSPSAMASGRGGHPSISRSTGTTSRTAPATP